MLTSFLAPEKMNITFEGKRALVTGAGRGIGNAIAKALAAGGAETYALSKTQANLDKLKSEVPSIHTVCTDLSDWEKSRAAVEEIVKEAGPIHLLVNNAALGLGGPFIDCSPDDFDKLMNVNVRAIVNVSQVVTKSLLDAKCPGSVVNISSQASQAALKGHTIYGATKAAVDQITRVMALELGPHNIRVNAVNPTVVMTDMGRLGWSDPVRAADMISKIPLGRFAEVEEVVHPVLFLLSDKASMINGVTLPIDGGFLAC